MAAYFAALAPTPPRARPARHLCVWGLRRDLLAYGDKTVDAWFRLLRAPRSSNPNLHAQSGVLEASVITLWQLLRSVAIGGRKLTDGKVAVEPPIMKKLMLPRKHAPELLRLLRAEAVTTMSLFPGVEGAVRLLKEHVRELK